VGVRDVLPPPGKEEVDVVVPGMSHGGNIDADQIIVACDFNGDANPQLAPLLIATQGVSPKKTSSRLGVTRHR
jgi:hypothetical protein